jgi:hypothetical protein
MRFVEKIALEIKFVFLFSTTLFEKFSAQKRMYTDRQTGGENLISALKGCECAYN